MSLAKIKLIARLRLIFAPILLIMFRADIASLDTHPVPGFEPVLEDPVEIEPLIPGTVEATGTHFQVIGSDYLDFTLDSTEPVSMLISSSPDTIPLAFTISALQKLAFRGAHFAPYSVVEMVAVGATSAMQRAYKLYRQLDFPQLGNGVFV